ncbi:dihydrofolate reductase [Candidatus Woesearchaeota archaeon]|nr:dihydrofolate reductase [Candidatus Woesearchaeota archaeon]
MLKNKFFGTPKISKKFFSVFKLTSFRRRKVVSIIVISCLAKNNIIGKNNDIPWRLQADFDHFKKQTMGHPCIMGDRTYLSLPKNARPLPGRENIVLTFDKEFKAPGTTIFYSFEDALDYVKDKEKAFICGGASIYKIGLKVADTLELTRIHKDFEGDTYFPEINFDEWELVNHEEHEDNEHGPYSFMTYKRKKK